MLNLFHYDFMIRAFVAGLAIALIAPVIGQFLVVRRYALIADTLAHISLLGVAIGLLLGLNPILTAIVVSILSAFGLEFLRAQKRLSGEMVLALTISGSLALAVVLMGLVKGAKVDFFSFLFGSITTVTLVDLATILSLGALIVAIVFRFYKPLFVISFDEELAATDGINVHTVNLLLIILSAATVSVAMRVVGILLTSALMVIPVLTAFQFGKGFKKTMALAIGFSVFSVVVGLFSSYYFDLASGGTIVLVALALFAGSLGVNRSKKL